MSILIKNAWVLTQDKERRTLKNVDIFIEGNQIAEIGKIKEKAEFSIDGTHKLILPGFVNTHTHLAMTLLRGYADDMELDKWLKERIWPLEAKLRGSDVYWGSLLGCIEMLRSGITTFADMYFFMEEVANAVSQSGLRALLSYGMIDLGDMEKMEKELRIGEKFVREFNGAENGRIKTSFGPHSPYSCSAELLEKTRELAERYNVPIQIHVAETRKEVFDIIKKYGKRPVEYLDSIGFLGKRVITSHCVWLTKREVGILAKMGTKVAYNPVSNMKLGVGGMCPIPQLLSNGVCVTLGTDGAASNNSLNMFETMKLSALYQKAWAWDPCVLTSQQVLDFATINGANALGISSGSIEKGKLADLILIELNSPNLYPIHNIVSNLIYAGEVSNIWGVIIDGKVVMENRKILSVDEIEVLEKAQKIAEDLVTR